MFVYKQFLLFLGALRGLCGYYTLYLQQINGVSPWEETIMRAQMLKWGNRLAVRIPKPIADEAKLRRETLWKSRSPPRVRSISTGWKNFHSRPTGGADHA